MNRPTKYNIIAESDWLSLIEHVNREIKVGWIPQGGPFVYNLIHMQAMCAYNVLGPYITRVEEKREYDPDKLEVDIDGVVHR